LNTATVLTAFVATVILAALFLAPMYWPFGFALWIVVVTALLLVVVRWHAANTVYRCPECGKLFSISTVADLVSPMG